MFSAEFWSKAEYEISTQVRLREKDPRSDGVSLYGVHGIIGYRTFYNVIE